MTCIFTEREETSIFSCLLLEMAAMHVELASSLPTETILRLGLAPWSGTKQED